MFIRLVDKDNFKSPALYIHSGEKEFLKVIKEWHSWLLYWIDKNPDMKGMPLGRLNPGTAVVDLLRVLTQYYVNSSPESQGRAYATLSLEENVPDDHVKEINLHDAYWTPEGLLGK